MKRKLLIPMLLTTAIAIAMIVVLCQKDNEPRESAGDIYEQIGKLHNEGLELFITKVEQLNLTKSTSGPLSKDEYEQIKTEVSTQIVAKLYDVAPNDVMVTTIVNSKNTIDPTTKSDSEVERLFTANQREFLSQLEALKNRNNTDTQHLIDAIRRLEEKMASKCTDEEMIAIRITASVSIYSAQYWAENYDRWGNILLGMDQAQMNRARTKKLTFEEVDMIMIADGLGAAAGAVKGAMAGAAGGTVVVPGVGTATGAVVGAIGFGLAGAIEGSILAGLGSWIYSWF